MRIFLKSIPFLLIAIIALYLWSFTHEQSKETPSMSVTHQSIIEKIENLGKLELVKINIKDVLEFDQNQKVFGFNTTSKVLLVISGEAVACIDLSKIDKKNIVLTKDTLIITLPQPEMCYAKINHKDSKVVKIEKNIFVTEEAKLIDEAYKEAERYFEKLVMDANLLAQAKKNAQQLLSPLFEQASGRKTIILFENSMKINSYN